MIRKLFAGVGNFFRSQWNQYTPLGQFLWVLALVAITVDAGIAYEYGSSMSLLHAAGFALVAVAFAVLPDVASMEWSKGKKHAAFWISVACVPLSLVAYQSHIGYGSAIRVGDIQQTSVHNAKFEGKVDNTRELNADIDRLKKRRDTLDTEMAALVVTKVGDWSIAVRPSSSSELDGAVKAKQLEVDNESARGGCKSKCESRTNELAHLKALQAKASEIEKNERDYEKTVADLAAARTAVNDSTYQSSTAVNQNNVFAKLTNFVRFGLNDESLEVSKAQMEITNTAIMGAASLAFLILAPILNFAAGRNRKPEFLRSYKEPEFELPPISHEKRQPELPAPSQVHTREVIKRDNVWKDLNAALSRFEPRTA